MPSISIGPSSQQQILLTSEKNENSEQKKLVCLKGFDAALKLFFGQAAVCKANGKIVFLDKKVVLNFLKNENFLDRSIKSLSTGDVQQFISEVAKVGLDSAGKRLALHHPHIHRKKNDQFSPSEAQCREIVFGLNKIGIPIRQITLTNGHFSEESLKKDCLKACLSDSSYAPQDLDRYLTAITSLRSDPKKTAIHEDFHFLADLYATVQKEREIADIVGELEGIKFLEDDTLQEITLRGKGKAIGNLIVSEDGSDQKYVIDIEDPRDLNTLLFDQGDYQIERRALSDTSKLVSIHSIYYRIKVANIPEALKKNIPDLKDTTSYSSLTIVVSHKTLKLLQKLQQLTLKYDSLPPLNESKIEEMSLLGITSRIRTHQKFPPHHVEKHEIQYILLKPKKTVDDLCMLYCYGKKNLSLGDSRFQSYLSQNDAKILAYFAYIDREDIMWRECTEVVTAFKVPEKSPEGVSYQDFFYSLCRPSSLQLKK